MSKLSRFEKRISGLEVSNVSDYDGDVGRYLNVAIDGVNPSHFTRVETVEDVAAMVKGARDFLDTSPDGYPVGVIEKVDHYLSGAFQDFCEAAGENDRRKRKRPVSKGCAKIGHAIKALEEVCVEESRRLFDERIETVMVDEPAGSKLDDYFDEVLGTLDAGGAFPTEEQVYEAARMLTLVDEWVETHESSDGRRYAEIFPQTLDAMDGAYRDLRDHIATGNETFLSSAAERIRGTARTNIGKIAENERKKGAGGTMARIKAAREAARKIGEPAAEASSE